MSKGYNCVGSSDKAFSVRNVGDRSLDHDLVKVFQPGVHVLLTTGPIPPTTTAILVIAA